MCSFSGARVLQNTTLEVDRRILGGTEEFGILGDASWENNGVNYCEPVNWRIATTATMDPDKNTFKLQMFGVAVFVVRCVLQ